MTPTISPARHRSRVRTGLTFWLVGLLASGLVVFLGTLMFGHVVGEEFCPQTFSRRSFQYLEIPLVHLQVSPVRRQDQQRAFAQRLVRDRLVASVSSATPRWDLVTSQGGGANAVRGDAAILCAYLDAVDGKGHYWEQWTERHPALAKVLWPAVARLAERQLYFLTPDLFEAARSSETPAALRAAIARSLAASGRRLAEAQNAPELSRLGEEITKEKSEIRSTKSETDPNTP